MFGNGRNLPNQPKYYAELNSKQQANRRRNIRRMERNEELHEIYPPFRSSTNTTVIHLHYRTPITIVNELIWKAKATKLYTIDTESQVINKVAKGAVVQIEFIHSIHESTLIMIECFHLPKRNTFLFTKIAQLCSVILSAENEIITWGPFEKEFKDFRSYDLFELGKVPDKINLQDRFSDWHNERATKAHLERERRDEKTRRSDDIYDTPGECDYSIQQAISKTICNCGHHSHYDTNGTWSLQDAIADAFKEFLDKTETVNKWGCGFGH